MKNQFESDPLLKKLLRFYVSDKVYWDVEPDLQRFGQFVISKGKKEKTKIQQKKKNEWNRIKYN